MGIDQFMMELEEYKLGVSVCSLGEMPGEFVKDFTTLIRSGIVKSYCHNTGSLLPIARNYSVEGLKYRENKLTHVLFIDDDMCGFHPIHVVSMLRRNVDIVGGICTLKRPPFKIAANFFDDLDLITELKKPDAKDRNLVPAISTGTAFLLVTTKALDIVKEETTEGPIWFHTDRLQRPTILEEEEQLLDAFMKMDFDSPDKIREALHELVLFGVGAHYGTPIIGEDINFCWKARDRGLKIWIDPTVMIGHIGSKIFDIRDLFEWKNSESKLHQGESIIPSSLPELELVEQVP